MLCPTIDLIFLDSVQARGSSYIFNVIYEVSVVTYTYGSPSETVIKIILLFADVERSPTLLICHLPVLSSVSTMKPFLPCFAQYTASLIALLHTFFMKLFWWMTTVNWVRTFW